MTCPDESVEERLQRVHEQCLFLLEQVRFLRCMKMFAECPLEGPESPFPRDFADALRVGLKVRVKQVCDAHRSLPDDSDPVWQLLAVNRVQHGALSSHRYVVLAAREQLKVVVEKGLWVMAADPSMVDFRDDFDDEELAFIATQFDGVVKGLSKVSRQLDPESLREALRVELADTLQDRRSLRPPSTDPMRPAEDDSRDKICATDAIPRPTLRRMKACEAAEFAAAQLSTSDEERRITDDMCYDYLHEHGWQGHEEYQLPRRETFKRYVRHARKFKGESKNTSRRGRTGRSVVNAGQI